MNVHAPPRSRPAWSARVGLGIASGGLFGAVALLGSRVHHGTGALRVDRAASRIVDSPTLGRLVPRDGQSAPWPSGLGQLVAAYWLPVAAALVAGGLAVVAWRRGDRRAVVLCLLGPALAVLLNELVAKPLVDRRNGGALAFPSGHATGAAAVAVLALVLGWRWTGRRATLAWAPVALALPAAMGVAVVRLGWHYPTDVVGGVALGAATLLGLTAALGPRIPEAGAARLRAGDAPVRR